MLTTSPVVLPQRLNECFELAFKYKKVILFRAPCGYGKTTAVHQLLKDKKYVYLDADMLQSLPTIRENETIVVDNLQTLNNSTLCKELQEQIQTVSGSRFVLLTRGQVPGWLMPFLLSGVMEILETKDMKLDKASVSALAQARGVALSGNELDTLLADSAGYPVLVSLLLTAVGHTGHYSEQVYLEGRQLLYSYFDSAVYQHLQPEVRRLLLQLSPFETVDVELARMISGNNWAGEILAELCRTSSVFRQKESNVFVFRPRFREALCWKMSSEMSGEEEKNVFMRAGLYFELRDDPKSALDCYSRIGAHGKMSEILQQNACMDVGEGQYLSLEKYYYAMPREEILKSPTLIAGMSMLNSLFMNYDVSDEWYNTLQVMVNTMKKKDEKYTEACSRLVYLDIALPQNGTKGLLDVIKSAFRLMTRRELSLPDLSVTSMLPSVINGGKDFCLWTKQDDLIYGVIKKPVEGILGRDGIGVMTVGMCENKFEKDSNYQPWLLDLAGQLTRIQQDGTADIEFAAVGLLARVQVMQGNPQSACDALHTFRARIAGQPGGERFFGNLDALLCRIDLRTGSHTEVERWMTEKAPADDLRIWVLYRYQYFTKALVYVARGDHSNALIIMKRLLPYTQRCGRIMDELHVHLITAICYFREKNELWQQELQTALNTALEYRFINPVAQYGRAILPLLTGTNWDGDKLFLKQLLTAVRGQAALYPQFLQHESRLADPLTDAEQHVLRLLCQDMSNQEICEILGIKLATVKTHVSHILQKLGVKSRGGAKSAAEKEGLI